MSLFPSPLQRNMHDCYPYLSLFVSLTLCTFPQKFSYFMHIKPPDDSVLKSSFPAVWWESKDVSISKQTAVKTKTERNS